jgi:hypothetical protein
MAMSVEDISATYVKDEKLIVDCNKFVQAVASKVATEYGDASRQYAAIFAGDADAIVRRFNASPFVYIGNDKAAADAATKFADEGQFVLGGLTAAERKKYDPKATKGHVVVIAPGGPTQPDIITLKDGTKQHARGGYPYCYQGAEIAEYRFKARTRVDVVFNHNALDHIGYAYILIRGKSAQ